MRHSPRTLRFTTLLEALSMMFAIPCVLSGRAMAANDLPLTDLASSLGITPESLVATGIVGEQSALAEQILQNLEAAEGLRNDFDVQISNAQQLGAQAQSLAQALQLNPNNESLAAEYESITAEFDSLGEQITATRTLLLQAALDGFPQSAEEKIVVWRKAQGHQVPPEFRVLDKSSDEWKAVVIALRAERRAERRNEPFTGENASLLEDIRAHFDVMEAKFRLQSHLAATELVFEQFAGS